MTERNLRRLLYTSGVIAIAGIVAASYALDATNRATQRADAASQLGASAAVVGDVAADLERAARLDFERANHASRQATLGLAIAATLTPLLIFLNVLGFAVAEPGQRFVGRPDGEGDPDPSQLRLALLHRVD